MLWWLWGSLLYLFIAYGVTLMVLAEANAMTKTDTRFKLKHKALSVVFFGLLWPLMFFILIASTTPNVIWRKTDV